MRGLHESVHFSRVFFSSISTMVLRTVLFFYIAIEKYHVAFKLPN